MHFPPRKQTASHKTQIHLWRNWRSPAAPGCLGLVVLSSELIEWNRASEMICAMLKNPLEVALSIIKTIFGAYGWPRMAVHYCRHGEEFTGSKWMKDAASPKRMQPKDSDSIESQADSSHPEKLGLSNPGSPSWVARTILSTTLPCIRFSSWLCKIWTLSEKRLRSFANVGGC